MRSPVAWPPPGSVVSAPPLQGQHHLTQHRSLMKQSLDDRAHHYHSTAMHNTVFQTPHSTNTPWIGSRDPDHPVRGWEYIPLTTGNWSLIPPPPTHRGGGWGTQRWGGRGAIVTPRIYMCPGPGTTVPPLGVILRSADKI